MLKLQSKDQRGLEFTLDKAQLSLGRDGSNDIVVDDRGVSGFHANIFFENGKVEVVDLGSTNGTFHNGTKMHGTKLLQPGDRIQVGTTVIEAQ